MIAQPSVTRRVNVLVVGMDGVPMIYPVFVSSIKPGGREPEISDHVCGCVPPETYKPS